MLFFRQAFRILKTLCNFSMNFLNWINFYLHIFLTLFSSKYYHTKLCLINSKNTALSRSDFQSSYARVLSITAVLINFANPQENLSFYQNLVFFTTVASLSLGLHHRTPLQELPVNFVIFSRLHYITLHSQASVCDILNKETKSTPTDR